jgi:hypothetical protein
MQPRVQLVKASVTLLPELEHGRQISGNLYRPHIVIGPTSQRQAKIAEGNRLIESYLGIQFCAEPSELKPGVTTAARFILMYFHDAPDLYRSVVPGATFTIREGPKIVGYGTVEARSDEPLAV